MFVPTAEFSTTALTARFRWATCSTPVTQSPTWNARDAMRRSCARGKRSVRPRKSGEPPRDDRHACSVANKEGRQMIRKLKSGKYRLYSRKKDPKTGKRKNLGTFDTKAAAEKHERDVQYFKRH